MPCRGLGWVVLGRHYCWHVEELNDAVLWVGLGWVVCEYLGCVGGEALECHLRHLQAESRAFRPHVDAAQPLGPSALLLKVVLWVPLEPAAGCLRVGGCSHGFRRKLLVMVFPWTASAAMRAAACVSLATERVPAQ